MCSCELRYPLVYLLLIDVIFLFTDIMNEIYDIHFNCRKRQGRKRSEAVKLSYTLSPATTDMRRLKAGRPSSQRRSSQPMPREYSSKQTLKLPSSAVSTPVDSSSRGRKGLKPSDFKNRGRHAANSSDSSDSEDDQDDDQNDDQEVGQDDQEEDQEEDQDDQEEDQDNDDQVNSFSVNYRITRRDASVHTSQQARLDGMNRQRRIAEEKEAELAEQKRKKTKVGY